MSSARTYLRFAIAGLFANVLAMACVVDDSGGDDDDTSCDAGSFKVCTCADGTESTKECNASGSGYKACECDGTSGGGSANEGGGGNEPSAGAGNSTSYAGEAAGGQPSGMGGAPGMGGANEGGASEGGAMSMAGAGGSGDDFPAVCAEDPEDSCATCYQQGCCDIWVDCVDDEDCLTEFTDIIACTDAIREERNVTTADLQDCALAESGSNGGWSVGLSPNTKDMVDCVAGDAGWEGSPWADNACKVSCFDQ